MLAAHRGTADAAGVDWKSAVYQKVQEEVKAGGRLTVERMVELGRVSRSGFYRLQNTESGPEPDIDLRDAMIAPRWQLGFQSNWINWKGAFRTLPVSLTNGSNPDINGLLGTSSLPDGVPLDWKDQFSFRAGFAHSSNPVPNSTLSPLTAAIMKDQITGGFGY